MQGSAGAFYYYSADSSGGSKTPPGELINAADVPGVLDKAASTVGSGYINTMAIGSALDQTVQDFDASYPLSTTHWENLLLPVCGSSINWTAIGVYTGTFVVLITLGILLVYTFA